MNLFDKTLSFRAAQILELFKARLLTDKTSHFTVKNYLADLRSFLAWYEKTYQEFNVQMSPEILGQYKQAKLEAGIASRTLERHFSALRKFFLWLKDEGYVDVSPFEIISNTSHITDTWNIKGFKNYLYNKGASHLTIKNYINDVQAFIKWVEETSKVDASYIVEDNPFQRFNNDLVEEYKRRLLSILDISPKTINRKLSSIRNYLSFADENGHRIKAAVSNIEEAKPQNPLTLADLQELNIATSLPKKYSGIAPIALFQRLVRPYELLEEAVATKISYFLVKGKLSSKVAKSQAQNYSTHDDFGFSNIPKEFYAPHNISTKGFSVWQKLLYTIQYRRPKWYKIYRSYSFSRYFHAVVIVIFASALGVVIYQNFFAIPQKALVADTSRVLSFSAQLMDNYNNPIKASQQMRFIIYNSEYASSSARLWEEVRTVYPRSDGTFSVLLGSDKKGEAAPFCDQAQPATNQCGIPARIFGDSLWLGITIGNEAELIPRRSLSNVENAKNAESVNGLMPITHSGAGTSNVLLALDGNGNLTIGGAANPTFQASGGEFKLRGKNLVLQTNIESNGNITLAPDGAGVIDLQKPLVNTGFSNNIAQAAGAVEIDDTLAVLASSSAQSAFIINQTGTGPLFSASSSGFAKFSIDNNGTIMTSLDTGFIRSKKGVLETFSSVSLESDVNGILPIAKGGTGVELVPQGALLYGNVTNPLNILTIGPGGACLVSNGLYPTWDSCTRAQEAWSISNGSISPLALTSDFLLGGRATASAKFGILNIAQGTPTATLSGQTGGIFLTAEGVLSTTARRNLILGNSTFGNTTGNILLHPSGSGNVGIGHAAAAFKLDVEANDAATAASQIFNSAQGAAASGLVVKLGNTSNTISTTNHFIEFQTSGIGIVGSIQGNGADGVQYRTSGIADFAEYLPKDPNEKIIYNMVVCLKSTGEVTKCRKDYKQIVGVTSENPAFLGGKNQGPASISVGLAGQVEVFVSTQSGKIGPGDPIAASNVPGVGQKAHELGRIIGHALQSSDSDALLPCPLSEDMLCTKIRILLNPSWYDPAVAIDESGDITLAQNQDSSDSSFSLVDQAGRAIQRIGAFSQGIFASLRTGILEATHVSTSSLTIATDKVEIAGKSIQEFIRDTVKHDPDIVSPTNTIKTNIISPLASDITIDIGSDHNKSKDSKLSIKNNTQEVASITADGNASFSGSLTSKKLETTHAEISGNLTASSLEANSASISGTLRAETIIATTIEGLDDKIKGAIRGESNNQTTLPAGRQVEQSNNATMSSSFAYQEELKKQIKHLDFIDVSKLAVGFGTFTNSFLSLGPATVNQLTVMDSLSLGTKFIIGDNSINLLDEDLQIQPLKQGGVNFLSGAFRIDTDGDIHIGGNANFSKNVTVRGKLAAGIISPIGTDLTVALPDKSTLSVENSHQKKVLSITDSGDLIASGSGNFARDVIASGSALIGKLNIFSSPAYAISSTEVVATSAAGLSTLKAYRTEVTIYNTLVTEKSLIYITPVGNTNNNVLYLMRQVSHTSFTVGIGQTVPRDVQFNWFIVN